ncbi:hypothetical protein [Pacificispira sp.]
MDAPDLGVGSLTAHAGLYAQDRRRVEVDAALTVLEEILPASV